MASIKRWAYQICAILLIVVSTKVLSNERKMFEWASVSHFSSLETEVQDLLDGRMVLRYLIEVLPLIDSSIIDLEEAYSYALCAIEKSSLSCLEKEKIRLVLKGLVADQLSISDPFNIEEKEIPGSLVLGGVEILVGALIHLLPGCSWLGKLVIADGIRRGFNGIEEMDMKNKEEMKKMPSSVHLQLPSYPLRILK